MEAAELLRIVESVPPRRTRASEGVRLVYDQAHLTMSAEDRPGQTLARAEVHGYRTAAWELIVYAVSTIAVRAWLIEMPSTTPVDVSPYWGGPGPVLVVFTAGGASMQFPVVACPSAPASLTGRACPSPVTGSRWRYDGGSVDLLPPAQHSDPDSRAAETAARGRPHSACSFSAPFAACRSG